jgi:hypothetical protein
VATSDDQRRYLTGKERQNALSTLTWIERVMCGRMIARQFSYSSSVARALQYGGPEAAARLCSARSLHAYLILVGLIAVILTIAGLVQVSLPFYLLALVILIFAVFRIISFMRSSRRWRRTRDYR